jgi:hypothetical protein
MIRTLLVVVITSGLIGCSSPVPSTSVADAASAPVAHVSSSAGDVILREQEEKLVDIRREYANCKDLGDYVRMMRLARARRIELDAVIRRVHQMKLSPDEHERILRPLREERDWHLQVIQAASAM